MSFACKRLQEIRAFDFGHTNKQPKQSNTKPFSVSERSADGDNKITCQRRSDDGM